MNVCGIIVEYNPFHNGHKFHMESARNLTCADGIIAVMSGSFTQRGKPALFDKFTRAKTAIVGGADLVIELPFCYACAPAQFFAEGGVRLLGSTGIVNSICFGSESGDISTLLKSQKNPDGIKEFLNKGMSYPSACAFASDIPLSSPNDILGAEYLRALALYAPEIKPYTVKRSDLGYHSENGADGFASATAIRKMISEEKFSNIKEFVPSKVFEILEKEYINENHTDLSLVDSFVLGNLRSRTDMKTSAYVAEGLENRFYDAAFSAVSIEELISKVKTKRYTYARLMRIISCYAVGLTDSALSEFVRTGPAYIRVLAANKKGRNMLSQMKKKATLPVITTPSAYKKLDEFGQKMFELDCRAADISSLATKNPALRTGRQDFKKLNIFLD